MLPCHQCITLVMCRIFLRERKTTYYDRIDYDAADYNYELMLDLFPRCSLLSDYIPVHAKNRPRGFYTWERIVREKIKGISSREESEKRIAILFAFYDDLLKEDQ